MSKGTRDIQAADPAPGRLSCAIRFWILAALVTAAALRLGFIFTTRTPAIYFDSVAYIGVADDIARLAGSPRTAALVLADLNKSGKDRKSLKQTAENRGFKHISHINARLVTYPLFLAIIRLFTQKIIFISLAQALLDVLTCYLVFVLAFRMFNSKAGVAAMWLYALYPPLVISPHFVMSETVSGFLLVALLVASHGMITRGRARDGACAGALLFLLFACRHVFQLLPILVLPAYAAALIARGNALKTAIKKMLPAVAALVILALPWMVTLKVVFGNWLAPGQGGLAMYTGQRQESAGWQDDYWFAVIPGWDAQSATALPTEDEYKRAAFDEIRKRPADFALLFFEKNARMWSRPQNEYSVDYMLPANLWRAAHIALMLLGIAGLLATLSMYPAAAMPAALIVHAFLTHGLTIAIARYNLPFMPVWIVFAAWSLTAGPRMLTNALPLPLHRIILAASCSLLILYGLKLNLFAPDAPGAFFRITGLAALAGFLWVFMRVNAHSVQIAGTRPLWRLCASVFTAAVFISLACMVLANRDHLAWAHTINGVHAAVEQTIATRVMPDGNIKSVTLYVDVQASPSDLSPLEIRVNGKTIKRSGDTVRARHDFFGNLSGTYEHYRRIMGLEYSDFRQWFAFPVDRTLIRASNRIELEWKGAPGQWCRIHGDYYFDKKKRALYMPHFVFSPFESSVWKFVDQGDNRLMFPAAPDSKVTRSARSANGKTNSRDLSSRIGVQHGQYRIRLVLEIGDGKRIIM